jgi:CRISPR-associated protein Csh2
MDGKQFAARSEFLFCYDARMCNPNGDPDENRPRIDHGTGRNLVTEFRLKRTIRDYLQRMKKPEAVFLREDVANESGALKQIEDLAKKEIDRFVKDNVSIREALLKEYIDLRLFGLLFAVEGIEGKAGSKKIPLHFKQTGPVQFAIGQSLHKVEEIPIKMTRVVPTRGEARGGAFGERSILRYSFIAFHGALNDHIAEAVHLLEEDVSDMMNAMWYGTTDLSTTSKYGQQSRLLLRTKYNNRHAYIGDLDRKIKIKTKNEVEIEKLEDLSQIELEVSDLLDVLRDKKHLLQAVEYACSNELICRRNDDLGPFSKLIQDWAEKSGISAVNLLDEWQSTGSVSRSP